MRLWGRKKFPEPKNQTAVIPTESSPTLPFVGTWRGHHPVTEVLWPSPLFDVLLQLPWLWWTGIAARSSDGDDPVNRKLRLKHVSWLLRLKNSVFPSNTEYFLLHALPMEKEHHEQHTPCHGTAVIKVTHTDICELPKPELHARWVLSAREGDVPCQHRLNYWRASECLAPPHIPPSPAGADEDMQKISPD